MSRRLSRLLRRATECTGLIYRVERTEQENEKCGETLCSGTIT